MELIKAHIINFGKLHDLDIEFKCGLNSYLHENGWGKTTLSIFIKAMFYGMEYTTSKDLEKNEKLKYFPWQGGIYGGFLLIEHKGKEYLITRTFGLKKNEDTFELRDTKTNKISNDFSENIGSEIFGINRETYGRSVHVTLAESPAGSTDISAKLNNLIEEGDVSSYDEAAKVLEEKATSFKAKRGKNGEISQIQDEIDKKREIIEIIDSKISQNEDYESKIHDIQAEISELKDEQDKITAQIAICAKYESKIRYEQLQEDLKKSKEEYDSLIEFFNGSIPSSENLSKLDNLSTTLSTVESNLKNQSLTPAEKAQYESLKQSFSGDIPSKEQIEECINIDSSFKKYKQEESENKLTDSESMTFSELHQHFEGKEISENLVTSYINEVSLLQTNKNEITKIESECNTRKTELAVAKQIKPKNLRKVISLLISAIFVVTGIILFILKMNLLFGVGSFVISIILGLVGILSKSESKDLSSLENEINELQLKIDSLTELTKTQEQKIKSFITNFGTGSDNYISELNKISIDFNRYQLLLNKFVNFENWKKEQPISQNEFETKLKVFVKRFCKTEDISNVPAEIQVLSERLNNLRKFEERLNADSNNEKTQNETKEQLKEVLSGYKTDKLLPIVDQVREIHDKIVELKAAETELNNNKQRVLDFENSPENDITVFENLKKPKDSTEVLQSKLVEVSDLINEKNATISDYQKIVNDNLTDTERKDDIETEIEQLTILKQEKIEEHTVLLKALAYLNQAKEKLDSNYSDPMKEGFEKYVSMIGGTLKLLIDTDLKISVESDGLTHDSEFLSDGYKDLVNFCSRMALVDALFKDIKPPIILDDPFVNLDDNKVEKALNLLKDISKEKQILYFACHNSRTMNN